jgi:hypothetical protein
MVDQPRDEQGHFTPPEHLLSRTEWETKRKAEFLAQVLGGSNPESPLGYQTVPLETLFPERRKGQQRDG